MRVHQALVGRLNFISGLVECTADEKKKALRKAEWRSCSKKSSVAQSHDDPRALQSHRWKAAQWYRTQNH